MRNKNLEMVSIHERVHFAFNDFSFFLIKCNHKKLLDSDKCQRTENLYNKYPFIASDVNRKILTWFLLGS